MKQQQVEILLEILMKDVKQFIATQETYANNFNRFAENNEKSILFIKECIDELKQRKMNFAEKTPIVKLSNENILTELSELLQKNIEQRQVNSIIQAAPPIEQNKLSDWKYVTVFACIFALACCFGTAYFIQKKTINSNDEKYRYLSLVNPIETNYLDSIYKNNKKEIENELIAKQIQIQKPSTKSVEYNKSKHKSYNKINLNKK